MKILSHPNRKKIKRGIWEEEADIKGRKSTGAQESRRLLDKKAEF